MASLLAEAPEKGNGVAEHGVVGARVLHGSVDFAFDAGYGLEKELAEVIFAKIMLLSNLFYVPWFTLRIAPTAQACTRGEADPVENGHGQRSGSLQFSSVSLTLCRN